MKGDVDAVRSPTAGDKVLRGVRHIGSARLFTQVVTWGLTAVTIHLLQPRDYGLVATAGLFTTLAQLLLDGGLGDILIAHRDLSTQIQGAAASAVFIISSAFAVIIFALAPLGGAFFHSPTLPAVIEVSALYLPLSSLEVVPISVLSKNMRFGRIAVAQTASSVVQGISTLCLAYIGEAYWALIFGVFIGTALRAAMLWTSLEAPPRPNFCFRSLIPMARSSSHMIGQRLTYFSIDNFDLFLLGRITGPAALGQYSVARNLSSSALSQISGIVNQVTISAFAARTDSDSQLRGLLLVVSLASVILFPLFWLIGCASQIALPLVFGTRWHSIVVPFLAFCAILPLRGIYTILNTSVVGTGNTSTTFRNTLSWALILLPLMLLGILGGANGVALIWIPAFPIVFYIAAKRISKAFSVTVSTFLSPLYRPAACAAVATLIAEGTLWGLSNVLPRPIILICQGILGGGAYLILLKTFSPKQFWQALEIARRLLRS